jgi:hypothetical protein
MASGFVSVQHCRGRLGGPLLESLFTEAGVPVPDVTRHETTARFPSLRDWLQVEVKEWLFAGQMSEAEFDDLVMEAQVRLRSFLAPDGEVVAPAPGFIVTAVKPAVGMSEAWLNEVRGAPLMASNGARRFPAPHRRHTA